MIRRPIEKSNLKKASTSEYHRAVAGNEERMNPSISKIVSAVPDRTARLHSGTRFALSGAVSAHSTQVAHLSQLLHWLTPLTMLNEEDQRALGSLSSHGRLTRHDDDEEDGEL